MQRCFSSVVLRGRSRFAESEFDDVATSLMLAFNLLIYFWTGGGASNQHGWISIGRRMFLAILVHAMAQSRPSNHLRFNRTAWRASGRTPRSRFDRTAIAARSSRDRGASVAELPPDDQTPINEWPRRRLWPDCGAIVARSWPDRGPIATRSWPDRSEIQAYSSRIWSHKAMQ